MFVPISEMCVPKAWAALDKHYQAIKDVHMRSLFEREPARFDQFSMQVGDILLDYSKNRATAETMQLLCALAADAGVCEKRDAMFNGMCSMSTENFSPHPQALRHDYVFDYALNEREEWAFRASQHPHV